MPVTGPPNAENGNNLRERADGALASRMRDQRALPS